MFSSPQQPLDETPATLVPADCPRPWAATYPARQRCVVTSGRSHIASVMVQNHRNNLSARSRSKFAAVAQVSKWHSRASSQAAYLMPGILGQADQSLTRKKASCWTV